MTPFVREARPADHDRLRRIQAASLSDPSPAVLRSAVEGPLLALVRCADDGTPLGYLVAVATDDRAYVPELAVAPATQRRGHGSALVEAAAERLREDGVTTLRLTARADDDGARSFYEHHGFEAVERVPDNYDGADGVVYERRLTG